VQVFCFLFLFCFFLILNTIKFSVNMNHWSSPLHCNTYMYIEQKNTFKLLLNHKLYVSKQQKYTLKFGRCTSYCQSIWTCIRLFKYTTFWVVFVSFVMSKRQTDEFTSVTCTVLIVSPGVFLIWTHSIITVCHLVSLHRQLSPFSI
jgi:hypothetical protein